MFDITTAKKTLSIAQHKNCSINKKLLEQHKILHSEKILLNYLKI